MRKNKHFIKKRGHFSEQYNKRKLKDSLLRAGVKLDITNKVVKEVTQNIKNLTSTRDIQKSTMKCLLKDSKLSATNYDLKRAIYQLGPTGYPFEILVAELFKVKGYASKVSVIKKGEFINHEVDVVAKRADGDFYCECKFHNKKFYKNDIKIPLYVHSRFLDIKKANPLDNFKYALVSNTQFSDDAIKYSKGVGLILISLNYPSKGAFMDLIRQYAVYPITSLQHLRVKDKKILLEKKIVVIRQMNKAVLDQLDISENQRNKVLEEIRFLRSLKRRQKSH